METLVMMMLGGGMALAGLALGYAFTDSDSHEIVGNFMRPIAGIAAVVFLIGTIGFALEGKKPENKELFRKNCMVNYDLTGIILPTPDKPVMTNPK